MMMAFWSQARKTPAILYGVGIVILSAQSSLPTVSTFSWFDKVAHGIEYFIFTLLVIYGWKRSPVIWIVFALAMFAFTDELHQFFVPGRMATAWDWLADMVGISMCAFFWSMIKKYERH